MGYTADKEVCFLIKLIDPADVSAGFAVDHRQYVKIHLVFSEKGDRIHHLVKRAPAVCIHTAGVVSFAYSI